MPTSEICPIDDESGAVILYSPATINFWRTGVVIDFFLVEHKKYNVVEVISRTSSRTSSLDASRIYMAKQMLFSKFSKDIVDAHVAKRKADFMMLKNYLEFTEPPECETREKVLQDIAVQYIKARLVVPLDGPLEVWLKTLPGDAIGPMGKHDQICDKPKDLVKYELHVAAVRMTTRAKGSWASSLRAMDPEWAKENFPEGLDRRTSLAPPLLKICILSKEELEIQRVREKRKDQWKSIFHKFILIMEITNTKRRLETISIGNALTCDTVSAHFDPRTLGKNSRRYSKIFDMIAAGPPECVPLVLPDSIDTLPSLVLPSLLKEATPKYRNESSRSPSSRSFRLPSEKSSRSPSFRLPSEKSGRSAPSENTSRFPSLPTSDSPSQVSSPSPSQVSSRSPSLSISRSPSQASSRSSSRRSLFDHGDSTPTSLLDSKSTGSPTSPEKSQLKRGSVHPDMQRGFERNISQKRLVRRCTDTTFSYCSDGEGSPGQSNKRTLQPITNSLSDSILDKLVESCYLEPSAIDASCKEIPRSSKELFSTMDEGLSSVKITEMSHPKSLINQLTRNLSVKGLTGAFANLGESFRVERHSRMRSESTALSPLREIEEFCDKIEDVSTVEVSTEEVMSSVNFVVNASFDSEYDWEDIPEEITPRASEEIVNALKGTASYDLEES